jgi:hypothetical protein
MRVLFCAVALGTTAALLTAQERVPAQPDPVQPKVVRPVQPGPNQPGPPPVRVAAAARLLQLEEEVETAEAARDVKKAHVRAAEVAVRANEATLELVAAQGANAAKHDAMKAKFELEMAKAQLEVRVAELREIEVKVKFAKKRLDEAKAGGVRPAPGVRPVPVDPAPERGRLVPAPGFGPDNLPNGGRIDRDAADDKAKELAELKAKLEKAKAETARAEAEAKKAEAEAKLAKAELDRILDIAMKGRVRPGTIEAAKEKAAAAEAAADAGAKKLKAMKGATEALAKEIEKLGK